jgi:hypothetical protein
MPLRLLAIGLLLCACEEVKDDSAPAEGDADADADADTDADSDTDADADVVLFINELLASNNSINHDDADEYDDWFELYNPGTEDVALDGWYVSTDSANYKECTPLKKLEIPAEGFLLIWADAQTDQGDDHVCFTLAKAGDFLGLYQPDGTLMDEVEFGAQTSDISYARARDGDDVWRLDSSPSPGESNE